MKKTNKTKSAEGGFSPQLSNANSELSFCIMTFRKKTQIKKKKREKDSVI